MKILYKVVMFPMLLISLVGFSQIPQKMSYQSVIVDADNKLVINQTVGVRISIHQGTSNGTEVYIETHSATTNTNGLLSLEVGTGTSSDDFSAIDWSNGPYYIESEVDPTGGNSYSITGISELLSVPYALYSLSSGNSSGGESGFPANAANGDVVSYDGTNWIASSLAIANAGDANPFSVMQPSLALTYCISTSGTYPQRNSSDPLIGEIAIFPYDFVPVNWLPCDGRTLSTSSYTSLYSLLSTIYGGNGITTFRLPDLRGRTVVGVGQGSGLSNYYLGQQVGSETQTLNNSQLPAHNHQIVFE